MPFTLPEWILLVVFALLTLVVTAPILSRSRLSPPPYFRYLWVLFLIFNISHWWWFPAALWILAFFSFLALREYFSLVDMRMEDRWGILTAYLAIPFMIYLIQIEWYGFFIVSIPVYAFLFVAFSVALGGGEHRGTVLSIGAIDFGLFLFVYCTGHIGYLLLFSTWKAMLLVLAVALCDMVARLPGRREQKELGRAALNFVVSAPITVAVTLLLSEWTEIPPWHSVCLGLLVPLLVPIGNFTISAIEADLGITRDRLLPGKGAIIDAVKSYLFAAPIFFHYIHYFFIPAAS